MLLQSKQLIICYFKLLEKYCCRNFCHPRCSKTKFRQNTYQGTFNITAMCLLRKPHDRVPISFLCLSWKFHWIYITVLHPSISTLHLLSHAIEFVGSLASIVSPLSIDTNVLYAVQQSTKGIRMQIFVVKNATSQNYSSPQHKCSASIIFNDLLWLTAERVLQLCFWFLHFWK